MSAARPSSGSDGIVIGVHFSPSARLRVAVPRTTMLDLRSGDGSITVEEITGTASLRTDDGSIVASRLSGEVLARTDDGSIRFREMTGKVDVETGDGSIVVGGTLTHLRAKTGDGSVRVAVEPGSRVEEDWTVETRDGSVEVRLPETLDVVVDAVTSDGSIRSNYPGLTVERGDDDERSVAPGVARHAGRRRPHPARAHRRRRRSGSSARPDARTAARG